MSTERTLSIIKPDAVEKHQIGEILAMTRVYGAELRLARVKVEVLDLLRRDGVLDELGTDNVYANVYESVADHIPGNRAKEGPEDG